MSDIADDFLQLIGTDRPGMHVYTQADLKLNNRALVFDDGSDEVSRFGRMIPANTQGTMVAVEAGWYKLYFTFVNKYSREIEQAGFKVKKRDFETLFSR